MPPGVNSRAEITPGLCGFKTLALAVMLWCLPPRQLFSVPILQMKKPRLRKVTEGDRWKLAKRTNHVICANGNQGPLVSKSLGI